MYRQIRKPFGFGERYTLTAEKAMKKKLSKLSWAALSTCAVMGLGAGQALAASGSVAAAYKDTSCHEFSAYRVCLDYQGEYKFITSPSGNVVFQNNGKYDYTVYFNGELWYTRDNSVHDYRLFKKGATQVYRDRAETTETYNDKTCTFEYYYLFAGGGVRVYNVEFGCVPS